MTSFYDRFKTDQKAEADEGVILDYGSAGKIRIHRAGGQNRKFTDLAKARMKPYTRQLQAGTLDDAVSKKLLVELYADAVVVGWEGVHDRNGDIMEFNRANVIQLFTDLPDLFTDVQAAAADHSLFLSSLQEDIAGNSQTPSDGTSSSDTPISG